jgi:hypothetical protein
LPAGQHQRIIIRRRHLIERLIHLDCATPVLFVPTFDFACGERDDIDGCAGLLEPIAR